MMRRCMSLFMIMIVINHGNMVEARNIIFPALRCWISFLRIGYDPENYENYDVYYRNNSIMNVAQTGAYKGPNSIEEYAKYPDPKFSPFVKASKTSNPTFSFQGYNSTAGTCDFFGTYSIRWTLDPNLSNIQEPFDFASMFRMYVDLKERYIKELNVFISADFSRIMADAAYNNDRIRKNVCSEVYFGPCKSIVNTTATPSVDVCESRLAALPATQGTLHYIDGNTQGCRFLHSVLARYNPTTHCPHLSLEPISDPNGLVKCQSSKGATPEDYFTPSDFDKYRQYCKTVNINPDIGHNSKY